MIEKPRLHGRMLDDRTVGRKIAAQDGKPAIRLEGTFERPDDIVIVAFGAGR